jgi:uncharacterized protein (DUF58 family)
MSTTNSGSLLDPAFLRQLEKLALMAKRVQLGVSKGERKSKRKGQSTEFADYRDYVQGDDLRHIDWNIYGRLNQLYLKLFQEQEDLTLHVLIDASRSMDFGTPRKIEFACKLAAAVGYIGLASYDRVSIEAFSGERTQRLAPVRGKASAMKLFTFLEGVLADGATNLEQGTRAYMIRNRAKGVALLISDFFDEEGFEGPIRRLTQSGSDAYAVHVLAPEEIDPTLSGDLKLVDSETNAFAEISVSRTLLKKYKDNRDGFCDEVRRFCLARGVGHYVVSSDTSVEQLTLDVLRKGGLVK